MAQQSNLSSLKVHADEEVAARIAGDASASQVTLMVRRFVPVGVTVTVPSRWGIVVGDYEIDDGGTLILESNATLEII